MSKTAKFERKWKKEIGNTESNPNALWDRMEQVDPHMKNWVLQRPKDSFTVKEHSERYGMSESWSHKRLKRLVEKGELNRHRLGLECFYTFADPR